MNIIHFNKSQKDANENIARMQTALRLLPAYLQHSALDSLTSSQKKEVKNNEKLIKNIVGSTFEALASANSETKADAMARGRTAQKVWFDEIAFIQYNDVIMDAAFPTFVTASKNAKKYGMPYGVQITTTPGNLNNPAGVYAYKFMNNCIKFYEEMYDMYEDDYHELRKMIDKATDKNGFLFIQFHYYELGFTDEWYISATKSLDPIRARREYLLEWINSSGLSPFDIDDIDMLVDAAREKERQGQVVRLTKRYSMTQYSTYNGKLPVIVSCDVSGGLGRDYNTIVAINPETLHPMAFFRSNNIPASNFKKVLVKFVTEHFPYALITIENNSIGNHLISEVLNTPIGRMLYREKKTRVISGVNNLQKKRKQEGWEYGHNVNTITRPLMISILEAMVRNNKSRLAYPELVDEIKFMEHRQGKIQHSTATHDDVTMAYLGGLFIVKHGTNMRGRGIYYNISEDIDENVDFQDTDSLFTSLHKRLRKHNAKYVDMDQDYFDDDEFFEEESLSMMDILKQQDLEYLQNKAMIEGFDEGDGFEGGVQFIPLDLQRRILGQGYVGRAYVEKSDLMAKFLSTSYDEEEEGSINYLDILKRNNRF